MDVINKFYSSVTQTVSQLSSVLPGNPVTREYDITGHLASAGTGCMWKIFSGSKKSTGQEASIFLLEKKIFDRYLKEDREEIYELIKRGVTQLTKIRHPQVLTVQHPLEESRESFAFATEPVYASLANILGETTNVPQGTISSLQEYDLFETEIKYGLLQLFEGIQFIHNEAKLIHRNINPHSVVLNSQGVWKLFGFDYCTKNQITEQANFNQYRNVITFPSLEYTAPECAVKNSYDSRADYYSIGMLVCAVFAKKCYPLQNFKGDYSAYKKFSHELLSTKRVNLKMVPEDLRNQVDMLLTSVPEKRPDFIHLAKIPYFDDIGVRSLSYLDTLFQRDNQDKAKFYKGLPQIIKRLPPRINLQRILPCLVQEFIHPTMIPFVLPNVFLIAEGSSQEEYKSKIFPHLKTIMNLQEPVQILLIFMQNMELLLKLTSPENVKLYVLPMVFKALESNSTQIQELCLAILPSFANLIDYPSMKNSLLPRIKSLCIKTGVPSVRVNCLLCIGQLLPHLDKWVILDDILLFLPTITPREPAVIMAIIGIYKVASQYETLGIPKEFMANKVLPFLWPLSIENGLSLQQYNIIMQLIKDMSKKVETEHTRKLEQLSASENPLQFEMLSPTRKTDLAETETIAKVSIDRKSSEFVPTKSIEISVPIKPKPVGTTTVPFPAPMMTLPSLPSPFEQVSLRQQQQRPNYDFSSFGVNYNNQQLSNQPMQPLLNKSNANTVTSSSSTALLQPVNISQSNFTSSQSSTILSKEDILEFLK